jgi:hypothetical protein
VYFVCADLKLVPPSAPSVQRLSDSAVLLKWKVPEGEQDGERISHFVVQYKEVRPKRGEWVTSRDHVNANTKSYKLFGLKPGKFTSTLIFYIDYAAFLHLFCWY